MDASHRRPRLPQRTTSNGTAPDATRERVVNMCVAAIFLAVAVGVSAVVIAMFLRVAFWIAP